MIPTARRPLLALAAALLAGCPIPQPVPGVGNIDAGVFPPLIVTDTAQPTETVVFYPSIGCPDGGPVFTIQADVVDSNPDDTVQGRWFVDYDPSNSTTREPRPPAFQFFPVPPDQTRATASYVFAPDALGAVWPTWPVHVVELVVSNGFAPTTPDGGLPNKSPLQGYQTQTFRWVFQPSDGGSCGP